jgi:hypothetical protein
MTPSVSTFQTAQTIKQASTYAAAITKGQKMLQAMRADNCAAAKILGSESSTAASGFTNKDWAEWGYNRETRFNALHRSKQISEVFRDLGINDQCSAEGGNNKTIIDTHHKDTKKDEMFYPATTARFCSIINRKAGLLIADSNFGPEYCLRLQGRYPGTPLPQLRQWSDITYLLRMDARDLYPVSNLRVSNLRYVLRLNIINDNTLAVIQHILESP